MFHYPPFCIVRTSIFPTKFYDDLLKQENWVESVLNIFETNRSIREIILVSSPSLYESLNKKPLKNPSQLASSLFNYLSRLSTRSTPFGLCSFISIGEWGEDASISFETNNINKRTRPDMGWIYSYIEKIYQDKDIGQLELRTNPLISFSGDRIFLKFLVESEEKSGKAPGVVSIKSSPLIRTILGNCLKRIKFDELLQKLKNLIPDLDLYKAELVIRELMNKQVLFPAVFPSLFAKSPYQDFLSKLPKNFKDSLAGLDFEIYDSLEIGQGELVLKKIMSDMQKITPSKYQVQVDAYNNCKFVIPRRILSELENAIAFLWKISKGVQNLDFIKSYHERFLERYGTYRTVPLLELLDEERGLGAHDAPQPNSQNTQKSKLFLRWEEWVNQAWEGCINEQKNEIILTHEIIDTIYRQTESTPSDLAEMVNSMDFFCKVIADSVEDINKDNFLLFISTTSSHCGNSFGRFFYLLEENVSKQFVDFIKNEEKLEEDAIYFQISHLPNMVRHANVAIQPCFRDYYLDFQNSDEEKSHINLHDIYVGSNSERFYLTLKDGKKELICIKGNLLTGDTAPLPVRFLFDVALRRQKNINGFYWGKLDDATFLPRVSFGKTILSPARWNLRGNEFINEKVELITQKFLNWANKWKLPQRFLLFKNDNYLLIDKSHLGHLREIANLLKKGEDLKLCEDFNTAYVNSELGLHNCEFVIPAIKKNCFANPKKVSTLAHQAISFENRWKLPGSEWIYAKFYLGEGESSRFIVQHLYPFVNQLSKEIDIEEWFFVRYRDPDYHVRFRLKLNQKKLISTVLEKLESAVKVWTKSGLIKFMNLSNYEREIERYGGEELIGVAESLFHVDSIVCASLMELIVSKKIILEEELFFSVCVNCFLKSFGFEIKDSIKFLESSLIDKTSLKGFRKYKTNLMEILNALEDTDLTFEKDQVKLIHNAFQPLRTKYKTVDALRNQMNKQEFRELINSLLHMHCNRLGMDREIEQRSRSYALSALISIERQQQHAIISQPVV